MEGKEEDLLVIFFLDFLVIYFGFVGDIFANNFFLDLSTRFFGFVDDFFWIC